MKRFIVILLACILIFCACCGSEDMTTASQTEQSGAESSNTPRDDSSAPNPETSGSGGSEIIDENTSDESIPDEEMGFPYLVIGGVLVTEENQADVFGDGTASAVYNKDENTVYLTLTDAKIQALPLPDAEEIESINGIYSERSLSIALNGKSEIIIETPDIDFFFCFGIRTAYKQAITIEGGSLEIYTKGNGNAFSVCGIDNNGALTLRNTCVDIDLQGKNEVVGVYADSVEALGTTFSVNAESSGEYNYSYGVQAVNIFSHNSNVDICGITEAPASFYNGPSSTSIYFTYWEAPSICVNGSGAVTLRGNVSVCYGNYFDIDERIRDSADGEYYLADIYVSERESGKNAFKAERNEIFEKPYIKITQGDERHYGISVGDKRITKINSHDVLGDGSVSYNSESNTLTLNNANIVGGSISESHFSSSETIITSAHSLKIELLGENRLECKNDSVNFSQAVSINGKLEIFGSGELFAVSGKGNGVFGTSQGISCSEYIQKSGKVFAISDDAPDHHAYPESHGIEAGAITVEGGSIYAESGNAVYNESLNTYNSENVIYPASAVYEEGVTEDGRQFTQITVN
ncbi:MAG: hypothetical protein IJY88_00395 [Clostridia bacterium]|nr:hypothetical protein [Clostridia bacterium]